MHPSSILPLDGLASEFQGSTHLCVPGPGLQMCVTTPHPAPFCVGARDPNSSLRARVKQVRYPEHLPSTLFCFQTIPITFKACLLWFPLWPASLNLQLPVGPRAPVAFAHAHVLSLLPDAASLYLHHFGTKSRFLVLSASGRVLHILCVPCMSGKPQDLLIQGLAGIWGNHSVSSSHMLAFI